MIAELGLAACGWPPRWPLLAACGWCAGAATGDGRGAGGRSSARLPSPQGCARVALSFVCLIALFLTTDLSVKLVASNSHSAKPLIFKLAGAWGNHEGSMLLWVTVMALAGGFIAAGRTAAARRHHAGDAGRAGLRQLGFYAFLLLCLQPVRAAADRRRPRATGSTRCLQDVGLAFHPPTLYVGYVGLSIAFSFAVGALVTREVGPAFARAMRPWVLGAWIFLTLGITAGSYWAYYELGWGGWWFWDPVENACLMPWLAATALLHSSQRAGRAQCAARVDDHAGRGRLLDVDGRHVPRALGHPHLRSCLRGRSRARQLHPGAAGDLHRRRAGAVRPARGHGHRRRALRRVQPRGGAGVQQCDAQRAFSASCCSARSIRC